MKARGKFYLVWRVILIMTLILYLWGCLPKVEELPFETIEHESSTIGEESLRVFQPRLVAITKPEDVQVLENLLYPDTLETLEELDYGEYFAIAIFQGSQGSTGYGVEVKSVVKQGRAINVYAEFTTPDPREPVGLMYTLPRQAIKVERGDIQGKFRFHLIADGRVRARQDGVHLIADSKKVIKVIDSTHLPF